MRRTLLFFLMLLCVISGYGQNYAPLQVGAKRYYINDSGYLRGIRIDSVVQETDYVRYKAFGTVRQYLQQTPSSSMYIDTIGASWIGQNIREYPNGDWHFPTGNKDTILLKSQAALLDEWTFFNDTGIIWFKAKVTSIDTETVFGVLDSVKKITLNAMQGSTLLASHPLNGWTIRLSKNNGFTALPDFYLFPYRMLINWNADFYDCWDRWLSNFNGYNPQINSLYFKNFIPTFPNERAIFDYQVGDVFCAEIFRSWDAGAYYQYKTDTVLSRVDYKDSTVYDIRRWVWNRNYINNALYDLQSIIYHLVVRDSLYYDSVLMPEEASNSWMGYIPSQSVLYCKTQDSLLCYHSPSWTLKIGHIPPCYSAEGSPLDLIYQNGLGLLWSYWTAPESLGNWEKLVFAHKNGVSCGMPLQVPTAVNDVDFTKEASLFPQPANDAFYLKGKLQFPVTATLLNLQQQTISFKKLQSEKDGISVQNLPNGLYFLSVKDVSGNSGVLKVLVAH